MRTAPMLDSRTLKRSMAASAVREGLMAWRDVLDRFTAEELTELPWDPEVLEHPMMQEYLKKRGDLE